MKLMGVKISLTIILMLILFSELSVAQNAELQKIDSALSQLFAERIFSGNVVIGEKGKIVYEKSFGEAKAENKIPLNAETIFPLGSITKTFTAVAVLKLKERGKLSLGDPVTKYLPDLPYQNVTIRHLLTHTSGLPEYQSDSIIEEIKDKGASPAELEKVFARLAPKEEFEPGSRWEYSNTNFIFLALIIEKASGKNYSQFLQENIFKLAQMKNTFVLRKNVPVEFQSRIADGYRRTSFLETADANINTLSGANSYYATVSNLYGAGGIYSTARDLYKFHQALQKNKILRKQTLAEMCGATKLNKAEDYATLKNTNYESKYGLGWFIANDEADGKIIYHPGGTVGYVSYFLRNLTKDQCIIVLTNNENLKHYTPTALLRILNGKFYQLDKKSLAAAIGDEYNKGGLKAAGDLFDNLKNNSQYSFREGEINDLGYQLLLEKQDAPAAIEILEFNAEKFPESFNVWDSLGEIYYKAGNRAEAIKNYEKSLQLNPNNAEGRAMLEKIKSEAVKP